MTSQKETMLLYVIMFVDVIPFVYCKDIYFEMTSSKYLRIWLELDEKKTNPPLMLLCLTSHGPLTQWKIHCGAKRKLTIHRQTRQSRLLLVWNKASAFKFCKKFKQYILKTKKRFSFHLHVSWQIAVAPQYKWHVVHPFFLTNYSTT